MIRKILVGMVLFLFLTAILAIGGIVILQAVGSVFGSDPLGICGPAGPIGNALFWVLLIGLPASFVLSFILTRRILKSLFAASVEKDAAEK